MRPNHVVSSLHQRGGGGIRYYSAPIQYQRGRGLAGALGRFFRGVIPFLPTSSKNDSRIETVG